jgi:hypothetical protein
MTTRPNKNPEDACCACGVVQPTPERGQHDELAEGVLTTWQPNPADPPQWICHKCFIRLTEEGA